MAENEKLVIDKRTNDGKPKTFIISENLMERYSRICDDYDVYTKTAIFNKLLDDGLKKYGY